MGRIFNYILILIALIVAAFYWFYYWTPYSLPWQVDRVRLQMSFPGIIFTEVVQLYLTLAFIIPKWMMLKGNNLVRQEKYQEACKLYKQFVGSFWTDSNFWISSYQKLSDLQYKLGQNAEADWSKLQAERLSRGKFRRSDYKPNTVLYKLIWIPFLWYLLNGFLYFYFQLPLLAFIVLLAMVIDAILFAMFLSVSHSLSIAEANCSQ